MSSVYTTPPPSPLPSPHDPMMDSYDGACSTMGEGGTLRICVSRCSKHTTEKEDREREGHLPPGGVHRAL